MECKENPQQVESKENETGAQHDDGPVFSDDEKKNSLKRKLVKDEDKHGPPHEIHYSQESKNSESYSSKFAKRPRKQIVKPGFDQRMFEETTIYKKNGLRYVQPYNFTFTTHCKGRWMGRTILDVFKREFRMESAEYYESAIRTGKITVNDEIVEPDKILKSNQTIKTRIHRHEPPVVDSPIEFVENNDEIVVINKPPSIPVHPCGRYRHNTIVFILGRDYELTNLHTIHRIDRLTSGILMFAKTVKRAQEMEKFVKERSVAKEYLCRVVGEFPKEPVVCDKPMMVVSHNVGVCQVKPEGKEAKTEFEFLSYNGKSSVVRCLPNTGRMHQIRVHLQYIGFPIVNDPIYNNPDVWGPHNGKGGCDRDISDILTSLAAARKDSIARAVNSKTNDASSNIQGEADPSRLLDSENSCKEVTEKQAVEEVHQEFPELGVCYDPDCSDCRNPMPDPQSTELVMYLHALSYKGPDWMYNTSMPEWANKDWTLE
eukprot:Seg13338.1 transcript_id=Seg13338.1/GoldUCD/mRNA.D3Y31 product="RNA pseudouridylate synthase domain-containing protein 2" protein_id=Seg13338.1/GoldUCD/D3Y31